MASRLQSGAPKISGALSFQERFLASKALTTWCVNAAEVRPYIQTTAQQPHYHYFETRYPHTFISCLLQVGINAFVMAGKFKQRIASAIAAPSTPPQKKVSTEKLAMLGTS